MTLRAPRIACTVLALAAVLPVAGCWVPEIEDDPGRLAEYESVTVRRVLSADSILVEGANGKRRKVRYAGVQGPPAGHPMWSKARAQNAYLSLGRQDEARASVEFYPRDETPVNRLSIALNVGDQIEIRSLLAAIPPAGVSTSALYAPVLRELDEPERALGILRSVHEDQSTLWPSKGHDIAMLAAYFGDPELALDAFEDELRYTGVRSVGLWYPHMSEVRQLPEFKELVTEINLVEFWRASGWADACRPVGDDDFTCR